MFMKHLTYFIFFLHSYQSTCTVNYTFFVATAFGGGWSQQVNINVISIFLLIFVIIIMMHLPCTVGIVTRCSFSFILCCLITLSIIFCWVQLDPSIYESLQKEKVEVGDVIYIEANSGAVKVWYVLRYLQGNWFQLTVFNNALSCTAWYEIHCYHISELQMQPTCTISFSSSIEPLSIEDGNKTKDYRL